MIVCEECIHDPIPNCSVCEELLWLHEFRIKSAKLSADDNQQITQQSGLENRADFGRPGEPCLEEEE